MHGCPKCHSDRLVKNGAVIGKPKTLGKACGYQCTRTTPRGKPRTANINAVLWYLSGLSINRLAFRSRVSAQSGLNWSRAFANEPYEKPTPIGSLIVIELDERWPYLKNRRQKLWSWKALEPESGKWLDWACGRRNKPTVKRRVDRLAHWNVTLSCTEKWGTYAAAIPADKLGQNKATTHDIERNHCRQCHWFGRFKRKSMIVSKSKEMVDLPMALFAKFWVNGHQEELLSLLT